MALHFYKIMIQLGYKGANDPKPVYRTLSFAISLDDSEATLDTEDKRMTEIKNRINDKFSDTSVNATTYAKIKDITIGKKVLESELADITYDNWGDLPTGQTNQLVSRKRICTYLSTTGRSFSYSTIEPKITTDIEQDEIGCWELLDSLATGWKLYDLTFFHNLEEATENIFIASRK